jgi:hypothetical protein
VYRVLHDGLYHRGGFPFDIYNKNIIIRIIKLKAAAALSSSSSSSSSSAAAAAAAGVY